eukprot:CAMPEP_0179465158 /NCGR_PEP_ID=MMETSP0799-20121207/46796_1 /TAXON_ID=46947 /ORGANISM="Geminigera cryophila, Strain CCMP2564" /LENGTH=30 /DNA_ID= /DNA_START= /DNA_END= /DNA_ORIENTATION=
MTTAPRASQQQSTRTSAAWSSGQRPHRMPA